MAQANPSNITNVPPPRATWATINEIDHRLNQLYMAAFAAEISNEQLNGDGEGYVKISEDEANRLVFCCIDVQRRIDDYLSLFRGAHDPSVVHAVPATLRALAVKRAPAKRPNKVSASSLNHGP
jgi:hypothetical protein